MTPLYVTIGCLLTKKVWHGRGLSFHSREATREFAKGQMLIPRPEKGIIEYQDRCPHCSKPLRFVVESQPAVFARLTWSVFLWISVPVALAFSLFLIESPKSVESYAPIPLWGFLLAGTGLIAIVRLAHIMIYLIDFNQGNATAALDWVKEFRKQDFNAELDDYKHEILSVKSVN
jgi:hypothetical protein